MLPSRKAKARFRPRSSFTAVDGCEAIGRSMSRRSSSRFRTQVSPGSPSTTGWPRTRFILGLRSTTSKRLSGLSSGNAQEYRIDPDRIALIGESAGGQLAGMAALNNAPGTSVKAVVAFYAPTDLVSLLTNSDLIPSSIRDAVQGTPFEGLLLARLAQLSPIGRVRGGMPPFLMIHGTADQLVPFEQSRAMCSKMQSVGASCDLFRVPGGGHGLRRWESNLRSQSRTSGK